VARQRGEKRIYRGRNWWPRVVLPKIWELLATYKKYGFRPTLRQVFYQLVTSLNGNLGEHSLRLQSAIR